MFNVKTQRNFPLPGFPTSMIPFYKEKPCFWKEKPQKHCNIPQKHSFLSKKILAVKRFPDLCKGGVKENLRSRRKSTDFMRGTKERQYKLREITPLPQKHIFKYTNLSAARSPLVRKFSTFDYSQQNSVNSNRKSLNSRQISLNNSGLLQKKLYRNSSHFTPAYHGKYLNTNSLYLNSKNCFADFERCFRHSQKSALGRY